MNCKQQLSAFKVVSELDLQHLLEQQQSLQHCSSQQGAMWLLGQETSGNIWGRFVTTGIWWLEAMDAALLNSPRQQNVIKSKMSIALRPRNLVLAQLFSALQMYSFKYILWVVIWFGFLASASLLYCYTDIIFFLCAALLIGFDFCSVLFL